MDFLGSFLAGCLIALLVAAALTFGFALLIWFVVLALIVTAFVVLRQFWRRWLFLYHAKRHVQTPEIIEGEYEEISNDKE